MEQRAGYFSFRLIDYWHRAVVVSIKYLLRRLIRAFKIGGSIFRVGLFILSKNEWYRTGRRWLMNIRLNQAERLAHICPKYFPITISNDADLSGQTAFWQLFIADFPADISESSFYRNIDSLIFTVTSIWIFYPAYFKSFRFDLSHNLIKR